MQGTRLPLPPAGRLFAAVALFEAFTWAGLLAGMWLKYGSGGTDLGVWLFGRLHGAAFLAYLVAAIVAGARLRWPAWALLLAILAAIPPLATLPLERWFRRRRLLSAPLAPGQAPMAASTTRQSGSVASDSTIP